MLKNHLHTIAFLLLWALWSCASTKKGGAPSFPAGAKQGEETVSDTLLKNLLSHNPAAFAEVLDKEKGRNVQVIFTQIDRDKSNRPTFTHHSLNLSSHVYFYPASTVKMPIAFLALQKLHELNVPELNREATMITGGIEKWATPVYNDPTTTDGRPTLAHYIKKIFLSSDNDAFNRLYEFLGQAYINTSLHKMGYDSVQILHRLSTPLTQEQNRVTNPIQFFDTSRKLLYAQPVEKSRMLYQPRHTFLGQGFLRNGTLVTQPFDFSEKNRFALADLHSVLISVIFPDAVPPAQRFRLLPDDYKFLYKYMSMLPKESAHPQYDSSYSDAYVKFLLFGGKGAIRDTALRIFNKVGDAYGFLTDVAYIVDFKNGVEFFLSATIYCNSDGVFNDDKYDYENVGFPFLQSLGKAMYEYELNRKKEVQPDLSNFRIDYKE